MRCRWGILQESTLRLKLACPTNYAEPTSHLIRLSLKEAFYSLLLLTAVINLAMDQPNARTIDLERAIEASADSPTNDLIKERTSSSEPFDVSSVPRPGRLARWNTWIENLAGFEARGIVRVPPEERHEGSVLGYAQMAMLYFSMNVTANNLAIGLLGPLVFNLGFVDSAMMATFGCLLGSAPTAYMSTWGPRSGNRTMVCCGLFYTFSRDPKLYTSHCGCKGSRESLTTSSHSRFWRATLWVTGLQS